MAEGLRVRPYVVTGGRTRGSRDLPIEALISRGPRGAIGIGLEQRTVVELCTQPRSIAEVAALARLPLGVVRVLVADLIDTGALTLHAAAVNDMDFLRRVLAGLHRL
ncbi:Protein of unknown function [Pseudonocardia thermophila]|uniref:DUF742 domain-containing protein n=1 Tax=Pseudonocardia thermophila TaxID=1848 RepID=A0A1M6NMH6_PSETH|nr:DUF742 domain-containing protein [Pseudonocardia thermophila]SHJ96957.1 Protein of unknown function [Pseudonocardia thermophila]